MPKPNNEWEQEDAPSDSNSFKARTRRFFGHVRNFGIRDLYWHFLDAWEEHSRFRWVTYGLIFVIATTSVVWIWVNPWWNERTSISTARQWLAARRFDRAAESIQQAIRLAPDNPVTWHLAAELARLKGGKAAALSYSHYAAEVSNWDTSYVLEWASAALQADKLEDAEKALALMPAQAIESSSFAQRISGDIDRRRGLLPSAQEHFEAALKLDGSCAVDEVPLGLVLLGSAVPGESQRGIALLTKWVDDPEYGAAALRSLLSDALFRGNTPDMLKWGQALRRNPGFTVGDVPNWLLALSKSDGALFTKVLAEMEASHASDPKLAATLMGWLNQIGHSTEALRWAKTLPIAMASQPSIAISIAEAMRQTKDWRELLLWTEQIDFGDLQFMSWAYGMEAARELGQTERAQELWSTLKAHSESNGVHAQFAASTIYTWGLQDEAVVLFNLASEGPGVELLALGSLARHYQVQRDAVGQYDVFRRLYSLRSHDDAISNNYAFFAALTNKDYPSAERLARDNFEHHPENLTYRATLAFVLAMHGSYADSHELLRPVENLWKTSSSLAFAYGFVLAKTGKKAEARKVLSTLNPDSLTKLEVELLSEALKG